MNSALEKSDEKKYLWHLKKRWRMERLRDSTGISPLRARTAAAALIALGTLTTSTPSFAEPEHSFEIKGGVAIAPDGTGCSYGLDLHFSWIPDPQSHRDPHFEWIVADLGLSFYQIPIQMNLPSYAQKNLQGTEFHIGSLAGVAIPAGDVIEIGLAAGLGADFFYHPFSNIGQKYAINALTQTVPVALFHAELSFHIDEHFSLYGAYAPHITLAPITDTIPGNQPHTHADHTMVAGFGATF